MEGLDCELETINEHWSKVDEVSIEKLDEIIGLVEQANNGRSTTFTLQTNILQPYLVSQNSC